MIQSRAGFVVALVLGAAGCTRDGEDYGRTTFYDRKIAPAIETAGCTPSGAGSSCHVSDGNGNADGNLSFESYDTLKLRHDLLQDYGPYGVPGLLLKVLPPFQVALTDWESTDPVLITTDITHDARSQIDFTSAQFVTLDTWIRNGAAENNAPPAAPVHQLDPCTTELGSSPLFDPNTNPSASDYPTFVALVAPVVADRCSAGNCHGASSNALHLTCGTSDDQVRWNYFALSDYVSADTSASEILRRALSAEAGGSFHEGGTVFESRQDPGYLALESWAKEKGGPTNIPTDTGFPFFAKRVEPMLVRRGCMMLGCHSGSMFHDYRLRGGSGGQFSLAVTRRNYELSLEQLALESPDPKASRLIKKNLSFDAGGLRHRGGSLFGDGDATEPCDTTLAETGAIDDPNQRPFCVLSAWFAHERADRMATATPFNGIAFVRRAATSGNDTPQDYGTYQPGAEVILSAAGFAADGSVTVGAETSLSSLCGLDPSVTDARRPAASWDGKRIAFAARTGDTDPFHVYVVDGSTCARDATIDAPPVDDQGSAVSNGELIHNFDPAFAPDGRLVFASTRGNIMNTDTIGYSGPQRAPADPSKLNANLYIRDGEGKIRQLTFLTNQEFLPSFMRDGRLIFTAEKRAPDFYQLAGRRMNLDGGDYHPLFGQRSTIDFTQFTDVVELADKNLAFILSDKGAQRGAGTLGVLNRSVGIDQTSNDPDDYLVDPKASATQNKPFYQHSLRIVDEAATGKLGGTQGAYRNPSPLPNGNLLVSYAPNATSLEAFDGKFDIVAVNPETGARTTLVSDGSRDCVWPVAVYEKPNRGVFQSRQDEANAATQVTPGGTLAKVTVLDMGVLQSLLFQNTRSGRKLEPTTSFRVYESLPPTSDVKDYASGGSYVVSDKYGQVYARRQLLGSVPVQKDNSAGMLLPGGVPVTLDVRAELAGDTAPTDHFQREEMQFYPGESGKQAFPRRLFNGLCGGCHGSLTGEELQLAANPDVLTAASQVAARNAPHTDLTGKSAAPIGPPFK
ncbi:MAG TPA: hypothetical protein VGQ57_11305 [Polyangiaceae bacterium]|nr:hypothetical protein [Polyangiaceae bacterium]